MSDRINGTEANPWTPIKREPLGDGKPKAAAREPKLKPMPVEISVGLPVEVTKAITDLAAAQEAIGEKLAAATQQGVEVIKAIARGADLHKSMIEQMAQQTAAMLGALQQLDVVARAIEKASTAPRKVTLRRDAAGVAVDAVSTVARQ